MKISLCKWLWTKLKVNSQPISVRSLKNIINHRLSEVTTEVEICGFGFGHPFKKSSFKRRTLTNNVVKSLATCCPLLKRLELQCMDLTTVELQHLPQNIENLKFYFCEIPSKCFSGCTNTFQLLKFLSFKKCSAFKTDHVQSLGTLCHLKRFETTGCYRLDDSGVRALCEQAPKIKYLTLYGCAFCGDDSAFAISENLKEIEMLQIEEWTSLTQQGVDMLMNNCPTMKYLAIKCRQINDGCLQTKGWRTDVP